jgi:hypothetical protein
LAQCWTAEQHRGVCKRITAQHNGQQQ